MILERVNFLYFVLFILNTLVHASELVQPQLEGLPENVRKFLEWEFNANSANDAAERGPMALKCQHYEIPLKLMNDHYDIATPEKVKSSLIIKKKNENGEEEDYVRWIINPEDSKFHLKIGKFLRKNGLPSRPKSFFNCFKTSSRSLIIHDPENGSLFSGKVSTNKTGGQWKEKGVDRMQVIDSKLSTRLAKQAEREFEWQHLVLLPEPMGFVLQDKEMDLEEGLIIRTYDDLVNKGDLYYLPGFSALHDKVGNEVAKMNGADRPNLFWKDHYASALGRASAEFVAHLGLVMTSAHSQQFLIEMKRVGGPKEKLVPTGRIVFRDFNDADAFEPFFNQDLKDDAELIDQWHQDPEEGDCVSKQFKIYFGLLHGMTPPPWIKADEMNVLKNAFYDEFERRFHEVTGVELEELKKGKLSYSWDAFAYQSKNYPFTSEGWKRFLALRDCFKGNLETLETNETKDGIEGSREASKRRKVSCEEMLNNFYGKLKGQLKMMAAKSFRKNKSRSEK